MIVCASAAALVLRSHPVHGFLRLRTLTKFPLSSPLREGRTLACPNGLSTLCVWGKPKHKKSSSAVPPTREPERNVLRVPGRLQRAHLLYKRAFDSPGGVPPPQQKTARIRRERLFFFGGKGGDNGGESERDVSAGCTVAENMGFRPEERNASLPFCIYGGAVVCAGFGGLCSLWEWGANLSLPMEEMDCIRIGSERPVFVRHW